MGVGEHGPERGAVGRTRPLPRQRLLDDPKGGATKINKVLFSADFAHMRLHGVPITGVEYQKLKQGPAPRRLLPVRDRLLSEGAAALVRDRYLGYPLDRLVPRREPDLTLYQAAFLASGFEVTESMRQHAQRLATQLDR